MNTIATPLSAVSTMQSLSFLSSLIAKFCALVRLGLGGREAHRTWFTSALSSSASCWLSLVQAASIAVIYSKLGGCLGVSTKLGPLACTDLCVGVKGLLDKLITHFGLGSSKGEESCRVLCLLGKDLASWEALAWGDTTWGTALSCWETMLSTLGVVPACLEELPAWGMCLAWEALSLAQCLTAWESTALSAWRALSSGEDWELPAWESSLSAGDRVLSTGEAWGMPAWEISPWGRVLSPGEYWELPA